MNNIFAHSFRNTVIISEFRACAAQSIKDQGKMVIVPTIIPPDDILVLVKTMVDDFNSLAPAIAICISAKGNQ